MEFTEIVVAVFLLFLSVIIFFWKQWYRKDTVNLNKCDLYINSGERNKNVIDKMIMVLGTSFEDGKDLSQHPEDRENIHTLMGSLQLMEGFRGRIRNAPLQKGYSLKAQVLLHAHFARLPLPNKALEEDQNFILKKSPALIHEMITIMFNGSKTQVNRNMEEPTLEAVESCMKISQMVTQALYDNDCPFRQLPYINDNILAQFAAEPRIHRIQDLVALEDDIRRARLQSLNNDEYRDLKNVAAFLPSVKMTVNSRFSVENQNEKSIGAETVVKVPLKLKRRNMMSLCNPPQFPENLYDIVKPVHCPLFPGEKKEGWWLYVADRARHSFVTTPIYLTLLKKEEREFVFDAPKRPGDYIYNIELRSDSYVGLDKRANLQLRVI